MFSVQQICCITFETDCSNLTCPWLLWILFGFERKQKRNREGWSLRCLRLFPFCNGFTIRFLVRSQIFVRERLVALGPDLAAAHFLCFKYSTYTLQVFHIYSDPCHILLQVRCLKSFTPAHDLKLLSVNILALSAFGPPAHHLGSLS